MATTKTNVMTRPTSVLLDDLQFNLEKQKAAGKNTTQLQQIINMLSRGTNGTVNNTTISTPAAQTAVTHTPAATATLASEETTEAAPATGRINFNLEGDLSEALQQLIDQYNATPTYTAKTPEQIRAQAEADYQSYYDQLRTAARLAKERQDLALAQQAEGLQSTYDRAREASAREYRRAYSQADRQMLSRGMQRSSYAAQTLANVNQQGAEAQQDIWDQQAAAENNIAAQRAQLEGQLADTLRQYDANYASDVMKRRFELENQDYERQMQNAEFQNNLAAQIYGYLQNNLQWNGSSGGGYGGGYSTSTKKKSSGGSSSSTANTQTTTTPINNFLDLANTALAKTRNTAASLNTALQNAAAGTSANTPTTKVIQGPVNQNVLAAANNAAAKYGVNTVFTNPLVDALNKKATTTNTAKTTTTANANKKITAIKTSNALR